MVLALSAGLIVIGYAGFAFGQNANGGMSLTLRCVLWGLIGALVSYIYFSLGLPGTAWIEPLGYWAGLVTTVAGGLIGLVFYRLTQTANS
jgi:hypothetical protein